MNHIASEAFSVPASHHERSVTEFAGGNIRRMAPNLRLATPPPAEPATSVKLTFGAPAMRPVVDALSRVARTAATVLLYGESGTGKEVAARFPGMNEPAHP